MNAIQNHTNINSSKKKFLIHDFHISEYGLFFINSKINRKGLLKLYRKNPFGVSLAVQPVSGLVGKFYCSWVYVYGY